MDNWYGIDVSAHQGEIDWAQVRMSIDFAILRAGRGYSGEYKDAQFTRNAEACTSLGIPFGVYWASYACNELDAVKEAQACLSTIWPYQLDYPVYFDFEEFSDEYYQQQTGRTLNKRRRSAIAKAFLSTVEGCNYYAGIYANFNYVSNKFSDDLFDRYDLWLAEWRATPSISSNLWQFRNNWETDGIGTEVDLNKSYRDFPSIIKKAGLNRHVV